MSAGEPLAARLNYAQCWEDVRLLEEALVPGPGKHVLSVCSAGDNSFALALAGARVTALDLSAPQIACAELKLAARTLDYGDYRRLLGVDEGGGRAALYRAVRPALSEGARGFWDEHGDLIEAGIVRSGRFERYLALFRTRVLPLVHRRATVEGWFDLPDLDAQRRYYAQRWDNWRWRGLFRLFFSKRVMAARGRSPEQFAHVKGEIGEVLLGRARHVLCDLSLADNPYVQWMLTGRWCVARATPAWITEAGHARLGEVAERVTLVHAPLDAHLAAVAPGTYDGFNLSDVFEYLSEPVTEGLLAALARSGRPGARLAWWELFVPRPRPASLADRLRSLPDLGERLHERDRAFVYGGFRVEEVL